ncbi:MAG: hypothetical protein L3J14_02775 [Flavobacteriaceae bacterium]|nr:hypothetical protein [Flavobacteriaceae bacterium]
MRHLTYSLLTLILFINISCSDDNKYIEDLTDTTNLDADETKNEVPCAIDFSSVVANDVVLIGCDLDLNGETITLPEHVTLKFDGGSITNGTLQFNGGLIDGELLNIDLAIEGSTRLIDTNYTFDVSKWNIVEGEVSTSVALSNRENMNVAITQVKSLRGYAFEINNVDIFFEIGAGAFGNTAHRLAVQIPSDFHFKMGDNCHLRAQPNGLPAYAILSARKAINIKITGGHLYGDKFEHTYTQGIPYKMHDSGYGVYFRGVRNSVVDGVTMKNFTGDGFNCHSIGRRNADGSVPAGMEENFNNNITIKNCTFEANRRNNMSIIDGTNIIIENNLFLKAGETDTAPQGSSDTVYTWRGVIPSNGIDFEAWRQYDEYGAYHTQYINDIIVRNNTFRNGQKADINLYTCSNVEVYENNFDSGVSGRAFNNCTIRDNVFVNNINRPNLTGITIKEFIRSGTGIDENVNNKVYNNTISGYENGIRFGATDGECYNNTITDFVNGIYFTDGENNLIYDNTLTSDISNSKGYTNFPGGIKAKDITVTGGTVTVYKYPFYAKKINESSGNQAGNGIIFDGVDFNSTSNNSILLLNSQNITIKNSTYNGEVTQVSCEDITLTNNN